MGFFPISPTLTSQKEGICIKDVYEYGFIKWTLLNFAPNYLCAILQKKKKKIYTDEIII